MEVFCTTRFETAFGSLRVVSSEKGLVYIELPNESGRGFEGWKKTHARDARVVKERLVNGSASSLDKHDAHANAVEQLVEFMSG